MNEDHDDRDCSFVQRQERFWIHAAVIFAIAALFSILVLFVAG